MCHVQPGIYQTILGYLVECYQNPAGGCTNSSFHLAELILWQHTDLQKVLCGDLIYRLLGLQQFVILTHAPPGRGFEFALLSLTTRGSLGS